MFVSKCLIMDFEICAAAPQLNHKHPDFTIQESQWTSQQCLVVEAKDSVRAVLSL